MHAFLTDRPTDPGVRPKRTTSGLGGWRLEAYLNEPQKHSFKFLQTSQLSFAIASDVYYQAGLLSRQ
jgi:hypothetical protein